MITAPASSADVPASAGQGRLLDGLLAPLPKLLPRPMRGEEAIKALGGNLDAAAARAGMPAEALRGLLRSDPSLWIGRDGSQFYVEPRRDERPNADTALAAGASGNASQGPVPTLKPLSDTFKLHSKPGSKRTIYLNFLGYKTDTRVVRTFPDGETWRNGGYWSDGVPFASLPFDFDGVPSSFSDEEKKFIQRVWFGVSETFSPFDVDVTTEAPAADQLDRSAGMPSDDTYGTTVVFTDPTKFVNYNSGAVEKDGNVGTGSRTYYHPIASGTNGRSIASVGAFDDPSFQAYYQPAWVFLSPPRPGTAYSAEAAYADSVFAAQAATHETGHTLGLRHDGNLDANGNVLNDGYYFGHATTANKSDDPTSWSPIMGSGSLQVNQWSKLEYPRPNLVQYQYAADTSKEEPDDYKVMSFHGVSVRADAVGGTINTAANLGATVSGAQSSFNKSGLIETPSDIDCYGFDAGAGTLSVTVTPGALTPMLDVKLTLLNSNGQMVATDNSLDLLGATMSKSITAGHYALCVDGIDNSKPIYNFPTYPEYTDYGSIGQYTLKGSYQSSSSLSPTAAASASPKSGNAPLPVNFSSSGSRDNDTSSTGTLSYLWSFGDSTTSTAANPSHTYNKAGTYPVVLKVTTSKGLSSTASVSITVTNLDTTPDPFSFPRYPYLTFFEEIVSSEIVTPVGYVGPADVTISTTGGTGGEYSVAGQAWKSTPGKISAGQTLQVRHRTSNDSKAQTTTTVTVGGVSASFATTTTTADAVPDPFTFANASNVRFNDQIQSSTIYIKGFNHSTPISVTGGEYRIDDGPWSSAAGTLTPDQGPPDYNYHTLRVRHTSANTGNKNVMTTVTIGGVSGSFTSTTAPANLGSLTDHQPNQFTIPDQVGVPKSALITSAGIKPDGYLLNASISIQGGEFRIGTLGEWSSANGKYLVVGEQIFVRHTSAATGNTKTNTILTIGGVSDTFTSTTVP